MAEEKYVMDENGVRYTITEKLGAGGQGATYRTADPVILIKRAFQDKSDREQAYQTYRQEINAVRVLPLTPDMHIASPVYLLRKPVCGYVMQFMTDMTDLNELVCGFLETKGSEQVDFYLKTGGLYRRLRLLKNLAEIFCKLRQKNLVYSDLSYNNIFISKNPDAFEVWLIDADNIRYQGETDKAFGTPECMAPEVVLGQYNTLFSDMYSFALISYVLLTGQKPFYGRLLLNSIRYDEENRLKQESPKDDWDAEEDDWDADDDWDTEENTKQDAPSDTESSADCYQMAEQGKIPWIDDTENRDNCSEGAGIRKYTISPELFECFQQTFSYEGRKNPETRPSPLQWYKALNHSLQKTVFCKECEWSYYVSEPCCPRCDAKRPDLYQAVITEYLFSEDDPHKLLIPKKIKAEIALRDDAQNILHISEIHPFSFFNAFQEDDTAFLIAYHPDEKKWKLSQESDFQCILRVGTGNYQSRAGSYFESESLEKIIIAVPSPDSKYRIRKIQFRKI